MDSIDIVEARSALAWWLECGVDCAIQEEPRNWLTPTVRQAKPKLQQSSAPSAPTNISRPSHETLAELQDWLEKSVNLPLAVTTAKRILPHGPANASIMLLSDGPSLEDFAARQPIGGDAWKLAERMLGSIGLCSSEAYCASLSPIHSPGVRLSERDRQDYAEIAREHIRLVAPARLLLLGEGVSQALLGKRLVDARGHVHKIEGIRTVVTFHPRHLIKRPLDKSLAWQDLLLLMESDS